jgi:hypothetical protein
MLMSTGHMAQLAGPAQPAVDKSMKVIICAANHEHMSILGKVVAEQIEYSVLSERLDTAASAIKLAPMRVVSYMFVVLMLLSRQCSMLICNPTTAATNCT